MKVQMINAATQSKTGSRRTMFKKGRLTKVLANQISRHRHAIKQFSELRTRYCTRAERVSFGHNKHPSGHQRAPTGGDDEVARVVEQRIPRGLGCTANKTVAKTAAHARVHGRSLPL